MKHLIITVALAFQFLSAGAANHGRVHAEDKQPELVFLLIGQSNMAGRAALEAGDDQPIPGVWLLDDQGKWIAATNPLNRFATDRKDISMQRISPGAGFAAEMSTRLPGRRIGVISNARGGSALQEWEKGKPLYDHTLARIRAVSGLRIDGVLWHQGESNRADADYIDRLEKFITTLRADLGNEHLPFVAGEIFGTAPVNDQLQKLGQRVPHTATASAAGLTVFDNVHFDRASQFTLGRRYADAMLKLLMLPKD